MSSAWKESHRATATVSCAIRSGEPLPPVLVAMAHVSNLQPVRLLGEVKLRLNDGSLRVLDGLPKISFDFISIDGHPVRDADLPGRYHLGSGVSLPLVREFAEVGFLVDPELVKDAVNIEISLHIDGAKTGS